MEILCVQALFAQRVPVEAALGAQSSRGGGNPGPTSFARPDDSIWVRTASHSYQVLFYINQELTRDIHPDLAISSSAMTLNKKPYRLVVDLPDFEAEIVKHWAEKSACTKTQIVRDALVSAAQATDSFALEDFQKRMRAVLAETPSPDARRQLQLRLESFLQNAEAGIASEVGSDRARGLPSIKKVKSSKAFGRKI